MKKLMIMAMILCASLAQAAEVTILEQDISVRNRARVMVDTRYQMDTQTNEGYAIITVSEEDYIYTPGYPGGWYGGPGYPGGWYGGPGYPGGYYGGYHRPMRPMPVMRTILRETVRIDNLILEDKKMIYQGEQGDVDCGTLGKSPVLGRPTLYLTGNCDLDGRVTGNRRNAKVVVKLRTK